VLISGDTVLATITPHPSLMLEYFVNKRILPDGYGVDHSAYGLIAYLNSLYKLRKEYDDVELLLPGHRLFEKGKLNYLKPAERAAEIIDFHQERCDNILRIMGNQVMSLDGISTELFEPRLRQNTGKFAAEREVMSHIELMSICGDVTWVNGKEFTSRATGSSNYKEFFRQLAD